MKTIAFLFLIFTIVSCNKNNQRDSFQHSETEELNKNFKEGNPFFDFDEAIYYHTSISKDKYYSIILKDKVADEDRFFGLLSNGSWPNTEIEVEQFENRISTERRYQSKELDSKSVEALRSEIFTEKKCDDVILAACEPVYRDIFLLKKRKKPVGVAKICLECGLYYFSKGNFNYECFGMNGEFEQLKKIITENSKNK